MTVDRTAVCRELGPASWVVYEELRALASDAGLARTNVRRLALDLGLSKDTVARALRKLTAAGLLTRRTELRDASGRFPHGAYVLATAPARRRSRPAPTAPSAQARLFDLGTDA